MSALTPDPWDGLRRHTSARIALGRAGGSLPTREVLSFAADHAAARDAVHSALDFDRLERDLAPLGLPVVRVRSQAEDRETYLKRPDLGRRLHPESRLHPPTTDGCDVAIIVADGLSSTAVQSNATPLLAHLLPMLASLTISPIVLVKHGRVAIQDAIGRRLNARAALILIGERPGLGSADSLGAYLVFDPKPGNTDANRNCVSNIHPRGLPPTSAAETVAYLLTELLRRQLSGVALKDERSPALPPTRGND